MNYPTYQEVNAAAIGHYQKGEFAQALEILNEAVGQFPANRTEADYLRSCLAVRVNDIPLTYQILDKLYADGIWFAESIFRDSPSYAPLQGNPEFEQRIKSHAELHTQARASGPAQLFTLAPVGDRSTPDSPTPIIFHLHGNNSHPTLELPNWQPAADAGWLVASPAAEDVLWAGGHAAWPDHESAERQVAAHFTHLKKDYTIDESQIILTGFSMGGDVAIAQTLKGSIIPARGFLVVGPGGPMIDEPESYRPLIEGAKNRNLRGVIMVSRADGAIEPDKTAQLAQMLNDGGVPCRFVFYPDEGHVYPADFDKRLADALAFVLKGDS
jgi:poly(3-hydroxybutyrate) depolymerase